MCESVLGPCPGLACPIPVPDLAESGSPSSSDNLSEANFRAQNLLSQEAFKAAVQLSENDRIEAVSERRKNLNLMNFLSAHGISSQDVNAFVNLGSLVPRLLPSHSLEPCSPSAKVPLPLSSSSLPVSPAGVTLPSVASPSIPSWSSIVQLPHKERKFTLDYCPSAVCEEEGKPILVKPSRNFLKKGNSRWQSCLVGGFLHSRLPFKLVADSAHKLWGKYGLSKVFLHHDYFVFQFARPEDRDNILALGPWYISNKLLILQYWKEGIDLKSETCTKAHVWVKFLNIPLSYWSPSGLSLLGSAIGKPLLVDDKTELLEPLGFARICIEMSSTSNFPTVIDVTVLDEELDMEKTVHVSVEYQGRPQICNHCKNFGHSVIKCPKASFQWVPKAKPSVPQVPPVASVSLPTDGKQCSLSPAVVQQNPSILVDQRNPPPSDTSWTTVSKGTSVEPSSGLIESRGIEPFCSNTFDPISCSTVAGLTELTELDASPSPNPIFSKLKVVDEKECRDLQNKIKGSTVPKPTRKSKGGGKKSPIHS